mgnify:CR=1 FL=1
MINDKDSDSVLDWFKAEDFDKLEYLADIKHIVNNNDLTTDQKIKSIKMINEKAPKTKYDDIKSGEFKNKIKILNQIYEDLQPHKGEDNLFYDLKINNRCIQIFTNFVDCVNDCIELHILINKGVPIVTDYGHTKFNFDCYGLTNKQFKKAFYQNHHYDSISVHKDVINNKYKGILSIVDILNAILGMYGSLETIREDKD